MVTFKLLGLFSLIYLINGGYGVPVKAPRDKQYVSLEEMIPLASKFGQRGFNGTWITESKILYSVRGEGGLWEYDVPTGARTLFIPKETMDKLNTTDLTLSPDGEYVLARSDPLIGFRYSSSARFALHNLATDTTYKIADHEYLQNCEFGEGHSVGFVRDNDVYYLHDVAASTAERRLTTDGVPGVIYNGVPDWVYEEEVFASGSTMWFSDDGTHLAIASFVDTNVDEALYFTYGEPGSLDDQYPTLNKLKYPKVGRPNPDVKLRVVDLTAPTVNWVELAAPSIGVTPNDHILGSVTWASNQIAALWLNRRQNNATIVLCDITSGECKQEINRREPDGWIEVTTAMYAGDQILDIEPVAQGPGDTDEWYHVVKYTRGSSVRQPISSGMRTAINIVGWDIDANKIYYLSTLENEPWQRHLWVGGSESMCISCNVLLAGGEPCQYASATISPGSKYYSLTCQGSAPSITRLYRTEDDAEISTWQDNAAVREILDGYYLPRIIHRHVDIDDKYKAAVQLFIPPELDMEDATTKYPMVVRIYTGPNSAQVVNTFALGYQTYISTNRSVIYCYIDGRGTGLKGKDLLFAVNNRLGTDEVTDVIDVTASLTELYPWIDKARIGIWGWSYGGYSTAMALTKDSDHVFKCGVSVAPVTSWLYYDTIYTERFMGTPQDNPVGYADGDVTARVEFLRNRTFLLMHGNADDNVHFQNAMALSRALQEKDIPFEQMSYPDEAHGLSGVSRHVYHTIDDFWTRCLSL